LFNHLRNFKLLENAYW